MEKTFENGLIIKDNRDSNCGVFIENASNTIGSVEWSSKYKCVFIHLETSIIGTQNIKGFEAGLAELKEMLLKCEEFLNK